MIVKKEVEIGCKVFSIETGRYARQANGSVMVRYGDTMVLVTAVASTEVKENQDFFPLQVEYREKTSAAGKFPGGFIKREGRPTEKEILSSRLIDRPIRPLFPEGYFNEVQVLANVHPVPHAQVNALFRHQLEQLELVLADGVRYWLPLEHLLVRESLG